MILVSDYSQRFVLICFCHSVFLDISSPGLIYSYNIYYFDIENEDWRWLLFSFWNCVLRLKYFRITMTNLGKVLNMSGWRSTSPSFSSSWVTSVSSQACFAGILGGANCNLRDVIKGNIACVAGIPPTPISCPVMINANLYQKTNIADISF